MVKRLGAVVLFAGLCTGLTGVVLAQSSGNACIKERIGGNPPCSANDVKLGTMQLIGPPPPCVVGTSVVVPLRATIESGPDRWDIGLWVNQAGGSALSDPTGNNCYRDYLHPDNAPTTCNQQGGPYYKGDPLQPTDVCGDVYAQNTNPCGNAVTAPCSSGGGTCLITTFDFMSSIFCTDDNGDGTVDVGNCTSWETGDGAICLNELGTDPANGAKCSCSTLNIQGLICTPTAEVCDGLDNDCDGVVDDGNVCTDCRIPTNPQCPAADPCATYSCNQATGECDTTYVPATTECRPSTGACDIAETCSGSSKICPADDFEPATTTCRPSAGPCDVAESCSGGSGECPGDTFEPSTVECRPSVGQCDVAESCTGSTGACPTDVFQPSTTLCVGTSTGGACDGTDSCNGSGTCVDGFLASTTVCRQAAGDCDVAESCTGSTGACPTDVFQPSTTLCVGTSTGGACDGTDSCNGSGTCVDGFLASTTVCRQAAGDCDLAESCTGSTGACPTDVFEPSTTVCVGTSTGGACDGTDSCNGSGTCVDGFLASTTVCRQAAGDCDVAESCTGSTGACPTDVFQPSTTLCVGASTGGACDGTDSCNGSGTCVDGFLASTTVCRQAAGDCDVAESCTGSTGACPTNVFQPSTTLCVGTSTGGACDGTDSCNGSGTCVDGFLASTTVCRQAAGDCDVAESCTGSTGACPTNVFQPSTTVCVGTSTGGACDGTDSCNGSGTCVDGFLASTTVCRQAAGDCDLAESCTGSTGACPTDVFEPSTTVCVGTSTGGACDGTDSCNGSGTCVDGFLASTTVCRQAAGDCDLAESCTGSTGACPTNVFQPSTTVCVGTSTGGACDGTDSCNGSGACIDGFLASTTVCRQAAGDCDLAESCTGSTGACPTNVFQPSTTVCVGTSTGGACDGTDSCNGSGTCVDGFLASTTVCRQAAGDCDLAESCTGSTGACPTDVFKPATTSCVGTSTGGACDGTDSCDGSGTCIDGFLASTTVCRQAAGDCDLAESCTGSTGACPTDVFQPSTTVCVGTSTGGACDGTDSCNGSGTCVDGFLASTTVCRQSAGQCDLAESCTGSSGACPTDVFKPATTSCVGTSTGGACDGTDSCNGSGTCVDGFQSPSTVCRQSAGQCDLAESCTGSSGACPTDVFKPATTSCVGTSTGGACDGTDSCNGSGTCVDGFQSPSTVCRQSAGQCDLAESCTGSSGACPTDVFKPATTSCVGTSTGGACDGTDSCNGSGTCVDGFQSPSTVCRQAAGDCDLAESCTGSSGACPTNVFKPATTSCVGTSTGGACDGTDSCNGSGTCVDGFQSPSTVCRQSAGQCDLAESCTGSSGACPTDVFKPATTSCVGTSTGGACDGTDSCNGSGTCVDGFQSPSTVCRQSAGQCDLAESCTGSSGACPTDVFKPATTSCVGTSTGGACDGTDSCNGSGTCVDGFQSPSTVCRQAAGDCDLAESCTGSSGACPTNVFKPATTSCVGTSTGGTCDGTDSCNGSGTCVDGFQSPSTVCRQSAGQCDLAESCTGSSGACPTDVFKPATTSCVGTSTGGACDGTDSCNGSGTCVDGFQSPSTVCRPSAGACDLPESCSGSSGACPADVFKPATTSCRPSTGSCDLAESCTGTSGSCPTDGFKPATTSCVGTSSGGPCDDINDSCDGAGHCQDGFKPPTRLCRPSTNECDAEEMCTGASGTCPADGFRAATTHCQGIANSGPCDGTDSCDGAGHCVDAFKEATKVCRPATNQCDQDELCSGTSSGCPVDGFKPATTNCVGTSNGGACDGTDSCDGAGHCADGFKSGTPNNCVTYVANLKFTTKVALVWNAAEGTVNYDLIRGEVANLRPDAGLGRAVCGQNDVVAVQTTDATVPNPGRCFYYVIRGDEPSPTPDTYDSDGIVPVGHEGRDAEVGSTGGADCHQRTSLN